MDIAMLSELHEYLKTKLSEDLIETQIAYGELTIHIKKESLLNVLLFLRDNPQCQFICLIDISGVDYPARQDRFAVSYHLLSPRLNLRIRVKLYVCDGEQVASSCNIYKGAEWYEREIYDLFGVSFSGHPDLRRILTDYGFEGHPLRKDFPTTGFVECRYDSDLKRVVYEPVLLTQEMRQFDFLSPWEGPDYPTEETKAVEDENGRG